MIKIDELMDSYNIQQEIETGELPLTKGEKDRILSKVLNETESNIAYKSRRKLRPFLVACILILAMFTVSFATYQYIASQNALGLFSTNNKKQIDTINSLGVAINQKISGNGLTIEVKEAIGDRHSARIFFDVVFPEGYQLNQPNPIYYTFESSDIHIPFTTCKGWYFDQLEDSNPNDNKISMVLSVDTREKLIGKKVTLDFTDFSYYNPNSKTGDDTYIKVVPGNWKVSFDLDYKDGSMKFKKNHNIEYWGKKATITDITLSPISITLVVKGKGISTYDQSPPKDQENSAYSEEISIYLKNGDTFEKVTSSGKSMVGSKMIINHSFSEVLDLSKVDYIEFYGNKIELTK